MVRVFSAYHYAGQSLQTVDDEVIATCLLDSHHLIVAKSNHIVEILQLNGKAVDDEKSGSTAEDTEQQQNVISSFSTIDQAEQLVYCRNGNYILTLEKRCSRRAPDKLFCRVYTNWPCGESLLSGNSSSSIRARIAGKTTPTSTNGNCLEVIELPSKETPRQIACCQTTGNIVIGTELNLIFYKFFHFTNVGTTKLSYIDFKELPFVCDVEFPAERIEIVENFVAICGRESAALFKLMETNFLQSDDVLTANSFTSADLSQQSAADEGSTGKRPSLNGTIVDFELIQVEDFDCGIQSTTENNKMTCRKESLTSEQRPINTEFHIGLHQLYDKDLSIPSAECDYTVKVLLRIKQHDLNDPFKCLMLKPILMGSKCCGDCVQSPSQQNNNNNNNGHADLPLDDDMAFEHLWKSKYSDQLLGVTLLLATATDGYVYQFSNNDKWMTEDTNFIASYPFTAPVIDVTMNRSVLIALTDRFIETYTLRVGHKLFSSFYEYNLYNGGGCSCVAAAESVYPIETCPRIEDPICLIGLRPFLGVRQIHCTDDNLVLMANGAAAADTMNAEKWTLYNLKLPTVEQLYESFVELANSHRSDSPATYLHLMGEAHVIMRCAREFGTVELDHRQLATVVATRTPSIEQHFLDSCLRLADFCVLSDAREEYCQAFPYYQMHRIKLMDLYDRVMRLASGQQQPLVGLVHTIKNMLIKLRYDAEDVGRMLHTVRKPATMATFGEELLELFLSNAPNEIAILTLRSQFFRDFMSQKVCDAINTKQERTDEDKLCLILNYCKLNDAQRTRQTLADFTQSRLYALLVRYWCVLFDSAQVKKTGKRVTTFSELTETYLLTTENRTIQQCMIEIFIYLTIETKVLAIDMLLKLLMDYLASCVGQLVGYLSAQYILQILLETYFFDVFVRRGYVGAAATDTAKITKIVDTPGESKENVESMTTTSTPSSAASSITSGCFQKTQPPTTVNEQLLLFDTADVTDTTINTEAMKMLLRIYLGKLKKAQYSGGGELASARLTEKRLQMFKFMRKNIQKLFEQHSAIGSSDNGADSDTTLVSSAAINNNRPILFLHKRPKYLNSMEPLKAYQFDYVAGSEANPLARPIYDLSGTLAEWTDIQLTIVKFQSLLSSGRLSRDILQEIVYFFEANAPCVAIDSFITILLPPAQCIDFLIEFYPRHLLDYVVSRLDSYDEREWTDFLLDLTQRQQQICEANSPKFYEDLLKDILKFIVKQKRLAQVLKIFPVKMDAANCDDRNGPEATAAVTQNEDCNQPNEAELLFRKYLTMAIDRDRADRLGEMIKTTGHQLFDTYNRNKPYF